MFKLDKRNGLRVTVLAAALAALPLGAQAAGVGKLTVLSPLGQPLQAELELTATREELSTLTARVASSDAFKKAGIDYAPVVSGIRITVDKHADGQPFLRLQTVSPVNDPFIDLLVDVTWSSGRLVREYTFLLDPPEALKAASAVAPVAAPVTAAAPESAAVAKPAQAAPVAAEPALAPAVAEEKKAAAAPMPREKEAAPRAAVESREVKRGDTLAKIAGEAKPEGVSLDQMLVALFRGNKDAFDGANMNRLRAGKILSIPSAEAVAAVAPAEARKIVVAQAGDFNAYRRKLAGAVAGGEAAKEEAPKQEAAGKITPKVEEKAPPVPAGKDKLAVSRTESAKEAKAAGRITALEEDLVARDKALKEAGSRIADLEKNLNDLKKLAEMKSQAGAQMQQQAQAAKAPEIKQPEAKPAPVPAPAAVPAPEGKPAEAKPAETKAPEAAVEKPAEPAKPAEAPKPPRKPLPPPPPPPPPPSFLEENGLLVMGGGVVLLGLAGFLGYSAWRRKKKASDLGATSRITEGDLTANSVFGTTGGQSVDTSSNVSLQTDFSQSSMSAIDADEGVDPVAEADVYMAYGRDAQAEEILVDALKTDPKRLAIHLKLLEIYAGRKNAKQFESVAKELHGLTNGSGPDWEKAAALGRTVDAANPLYGGLPGAEAPAAPGMAELAATTIIVPPTEAAKLSETVTMPGQLAQIAAAAEAAPQPVAPEALDFDLDLGAPAAAPQAAPQPMAAPAEEISSLDFDLDLGGAAAVPAPAAPQASHLDVELEMPPAVPAAPVAVEPATLDFDLDLGTPAAAPAPAAPAPEATPAMDFDFDLGSLGAEAPAPVPEAGAAPALDLSAISLDLGAPPAPAPAAAAPVGDENPEVATKLELAQAYEEMGDKEGARELLQEVLNEGSPAQREAARQKLASLA